MTHTHPYHVILNARNTQTQVVLGIWNEVVRNLIVRRGSVKTVVSGLRGDTAKLVGRMSLQLGLTEETVWREAREAI